LSPHDTFIHENFFSASHQVAWVFDHHYDEEGCFGWSEGEIRRLRRFEIATQVPDTPPQPEPDVVAPRQTTTPTEPREQPPQKGLRAAWERIPIRKRFTLLLVGLAVLLAVVAVPLSILFGSGSFKLPSAKQFFERIRHTIRQPSSQPVDEPPVDAGGTGLSSGGALAPTLTTNDVSDTSVQREPPDMTETNTNVEPTPKPDSPGLAVDPPPDSGSSEPN